MHNHAGLFDRLVGSNLGLWDRRQRGDPLLSAPAYPPDLYVTDCLVFGPAVPRR